MDAQPYENEYFYDLGFEAKNYTLCDQFGGGYTLFPAVNLKNQYPHLGKLSTTPSFIAQSHSLYRWSPPNLSCPTVVLDAQLYGTNYYLCGYRIRNGSKLGFMAKINSSGYLQWSHEYESINSINALYVFSSGIMSCGYTLQPNPDNSISKIAAITFSDLNGSNYWTKITPDPTSTEFFFFDSEFLDITPINGVADPQEFALIGYTNLGQTYLYDYDGKDILLSTIDEYGNSFTANYLEISNYFSTATNHASGISIVSRPNGSESTLGIAVNMTHSDAGYTQSFDRILVADVNLNASVNWAYEIAGKPLQYDPQNTYAKNIIYDGKYYVIVGAVDLEVVLQGRETDGYRLRVQADDGVIADIYSYGGLGPDTLMKTRYLDGEDYVHAGHSSHTNTLSPWIIKGVSPYDCESFIIETDIDEIPLEHHHMNSTDLLHDVVEISFSKLDPSYSTDSLCNEVVPFAKIGEEKMIDSDLNMQYDINSNELRIESGENELLFRIFSILGQVAMEESVPGSSIIDLSPLTPGVYLVNITSSKNVTMTQKIIVGK